MFCVSVLGWLSRSGLVGHCLHSLVELSLVDQELGHLGDRLEILIEFVHEWHSSRDVVSEDLHVAHTRKVLHNSSEGVSMSHNDELLSVLDLGAERVVPVGEHTIKSSLQRLCSREAVSRELLVASVVHGMALNIIQVDVRRRHIVTSSPESHLLNSVLLSGLSLVESLELAVMSLVEAPGLDVGDPELVHFLGDCVESHDCTCEH